MHVACLLVDNTVDAKHKCTECLLSGAMQAFTTDKRHAALPRSKHNHTDHPWCQTQQLVASLAV